MLLEFDLVQGVQQNILMDVKNERIHILPKELKDLRTVLNEYIDYDITDCLPIKDPINRPSWVEIIEVDFEESQIHEVFSLADKLLSEYILFHVAEIKDFEFLVADIEQRKKRGDLMLNQVIISVKFDKELCIEMEGNKGFVLVIEDADLMRQRQIAPENFIINRATILSADTRNNFYYSRVVVDRKGFIKPHFKSDYEDFHIKDDLEPEVLLNASEFKDLWMLSKNQIEGCKTCEFRKICFDTSVPVKNENGNFHRPVACNYNHETLSWKENIDAMQV